MLITFAIFSATSTLSLQTFISVFAKNSSISLYPILNPIFSSYSLASITFSLSLTIYATIAPYVNVSTSVFIFSILLTTALVGFFLYYYIEYYFLYIYFYFFIFLKWLNLVLSHYLYYL